MQQPSYQPPHQPQSQAQSPYAAPATQPHYQPFQTNSGNIPPGGLRIKPTKGLAIGCTILMIVVIITKIIGIIFYSSYKSYFTSIFELRKNLVFIANLEKNIEHLAIAIIATSILFIVIFLIWKHRAVSNSISIRGSHGLPPNKIRPGWAVGYYFIPILNLVMPVKAMAETYATSFQTRASMLIVGWWGAFIISIVLSKIGQVMITAAISSRYDGQASLDKFSNGITLHMASHVLSITAGIFLLIIIYCIALFVMLIYSISILQHLPSILFFSSLQNSQVTRI